MHRRCLPRALQTAVSRPFSLPTAVAGNAPQTAANRRNFTILTASHKRPFLMVKMLQWECYKPPANGRVLGAQQTAVSCLYPVTAVAGQVPTNGR